MTERIIEAFESKFQKKFTLREIKEEYPVVEILDVWLEHEGLVGYTRDIIDFLGECDIYIEE